MSATRPQVIEQKPPFWSRPRVFIGVCMAIVAGLGGALYTQDNVKSAATLVSTPLPVYSTTPLPGKSEMPPNA